MFECSSCTTRDEPCVIAHVPVEHRRDRGDSYFIRCVCCAAAQRTCLFALAAAPRRQALRWLQRNAGKGKDSAAAFLAPLHVVLHRAEADGGRLKDVADIWYAPDEVLRVPISRPAR